MTEADRDEALRAMAANRGCRLVKSRRRAPGSGDYGRYGLRDAATGQDVFGFGPGGLTATPDEIENYLRGGLRSSWKQSLREAPAVPKAGKRKAAKPEAEAPEPKPEPEPAPPPPPPPAPEPTLSVREAATRDSEAISALLDALGFPTDASDIRRRLPRLRKAGEPPLVAVEEKAVIGCLAWHVTPVLHRPAPVGRVTMMVVAEAARRRGVGAALLEAAEARLAAAGCGLVEVTSNIELGGAHAFYRAQGYERTSYRFAKKLKGG
jgi:ribosomal protein S18 acetylase RimI-like enzyme